MSVKKYDWEAIIRETNEILTRFAPSKMTLREIYYRLVAKGVVPNTFQAYKAVMRVLVRAREEGTVDERRIEDPERETVGGDWGYAGTADFIAQKREELRNFWNNYTRPVWETQPHDVEIWLEKRALRTLTVEALSGYRVKINVARGYSSFTFIRAAAERADGTRPLILLHVGDFDPSGMDMTRDLEDRMTRYGALGLTVKRVALTKEQVETLSLPPQPVKITDVRSKKFQKEYGSNVWELEALPRDVLQKIIRDAVEAEIVDKDAWLERTQEIVDETEELREWNAKLIEAVDQHEFN